MIFNINAIFDRFLDLMLRITCPSAGAVVILLCFLLTSTTSFEHMLNSYEKFTDSRTGKPCQPPPTVSAVNGSNVTPESNSSTTFYGLPTMLPSLLADYNASALGGERGLIISVQGRNATSEPDYCIKVSAIGGCRVGKMEED